MINMYDVIVIGAGAAGMMAAVAAGRLGARTCLLEQNERFISRARDAAI